MPHRDALAWILPFIERHVDLRSLVISLDRPEDRARYHVVTGVREHDGRIWMGSLNEPAIAVYS